MYDYRRFRTGRLEGWFWTALFLLGLTLLFMGIRASAAQATDNTARPEFVEKGDNVQFTLKAMGCLTKDSLLAAVHAAANKDMDSFKHNWTMGGCTLIPEKTAGLIVDSEVGGLFSVSSFYKVRPTPALPPFMNPEAAFWVEDGQMIDGQYKYVLSRVDSK